MRANPVRQLLGPCGFRIGVITGPQGGYKNLGITNLTRGRVDHRHRLTCVVDKQTLTGTMILAPDQVQLATGFGVQFQPEYAPGTVAKQ